MADPVFKVTKDPSAILPYGFDWAAWLGADTISASTWAAVPAANITISSNSFTVTTTTVTLSGGTAGNTVSLTNHITTTAGLQDDRTFSVTLDDR